MCLAGTNQLPRKLVNQLLNAVGLDWDDQVSFNKLKDMVKLVPAMCCFMKYDTNKSGSLSHDEVEKIAKDLVDSRLANKGRRRRATAKLLVSSSRTEWVALARRWCTTLGSRTPAVLCRHKVINMCWPMQWKASCQGLDL